MQYRTQDHWKKDRTNAYCNSQTAIFAATAAVHHRNFICRRGIRGNLASIGLRPFRPPCRRKGARSADGRPAAASAAPESATVTVTLHATNSHLISPSSQEAEQHAPIISASGSSCGASGAKFNSVVKLGASGVLTFHGAASASPSMSPLHICLPKASPAPPPSCPQSLHVAISFGSSQRRTLKSLSPASSLPSSHSHQRSAAERPMKPSSTLLAQSASIDRITAPTIASELRRNSHGKTSRAD